MNIDLGIRVKYTTNNYDNTFFTECLLCLRQCARFPVWNMLLNPHNNCVRSVLLLFPFIHEDSEDQRDEVIHSKLYSQVGDRAQS